MLDKPSEIQQRFTALNDLLTQHRPLWETRPFVEIKCDWENEFPVLAQWLRGLSHEQVDMIEADHETLYDFEAPTELLGWHQLASAQTQLGYFHTNSNRHLDDPALGHAIPERKWRQIRTFVETCLGLLPSSTKNVIDWCAGKGHVGRMLNLAGGHHTTALEHRSDLCECGVQLAQERHQSHCRFETVDVLTGSAEIFFTEADAAIALHACGHLTDALFEAGIRHCTPAMISVPCCYHHLGGDEQYRARSQFARASGLELAQHNLRLATAHESVARIPIRKARRREMAYRLGLDLLIREASGVDRYQQQGPFSKAILNLDFRGFCEAASQQLDLPLPAQFDGERAEAAGIERARQARALSLVRAVFRRPLELWLVLDRALRLLEADRPVSVGLLCPTEITPRNIMVASCLN